MSSSKREKILTPGYRSESVLSTLIRIKQLKNITGSYGETTTSSASSNRAKRSLRLFLLIKVKS